MLPESHEKSFCNTISTAPLPSGTLLVTIHNCFGIAFASKNNENHWFFQWKCALKRFKLREIINCPMNMVYTTGNNVGIEWECVLRSLKTNLFMKTTKKSWVSLTVGFPIEQNRDPQTLKKYGSCKKKVQLGYSPPPPPPGGPCASLGLRIVD